MPRHLHTSPACYWGLLPGRGAHSRPWKLAPQHKPRHSVTPCWAPLHTNLQFLSFYSQVSLDSFLGMVPVLAPALVPAPPSHHPAVEGSSHNAQVVSLPPSSAPCVTSIKRPSLSWPPLPHLSREITSAPDSQAGQEEEMSSDLKPLLLCPALSEVLHDCVVRKRVREWHPPYNHS